MKTKTLVAATRNRGKIHELRELLAELPFRLCGLDEFDSTLEVEETGATFIENAELKASTYARHIGEMAFADDSGLVVDALGGDPGVQSARYAGKNASDAERISKLLRELAAADSGDRGARFVCAIAVADRDGRILASFEGFCEGSIAFEPRGTNGFGYDPVFVPAGFAKSFGELDDAIKSQISHRAAAAAGIKRFFQEFYGNPT